MRNPERIYNKEILLPLSVLGLFAISLFAFSNKSREIIRTRDELTCQGCGRKQDDGWALHAAHNPNSHHKTGIFYDDPSSGSMRCIDCHIKQHESGTTLGKSGDKKAVSLLKRLSVKIRR